MTVAAEVKTHPGLGILLFTVVEAVVLTVWLSLLGVPLGNGIVAGLEITAGLLVEHTLAYNVGAGRPIFSLPSF